VSLCSTVGSPFICAMRLMIFSCKFGAPLFSQDGNHVRLGHEQVVVRHVELADAVHAEEIQGIRHAAVQMFHESFASKSPDEAIDGGVRHVAIACARRPRLFQHDGVGDDHAAARAKQPGALLEGFLVVADVVEVAREQDRVEGGVLERSPSIDSSVDIALVAIQSDADA
jgi:hypothetical protein